MSTLVTYMSEVTEDHEDRADISDYLGREYLLGDHTKGFVRTSIGPR